MHLGLRKVMGDEVATSKNITELIGVYDADSTLLGEVSYWIGARLGTTHCSLCELTHGLFTQKSEWKECAQNFSVPFLTFHRNDAPADVLHIANGMFPVVLSRSDDELAIILSNEELENFNGSTSQFTQWIQSFLAAEAR